MLFLIAQYVFRSNQLWPDNPTWSAKTLDEVRIRFEVDVALVLRLRQVVARSKLDDYLAEGENILGPCLVAGLLAVEIGMGEPGILNFKKRLACPPKPLPLIGHVPDFLQPTKVCHVSYSFTIISSAAAGGAVKSPYQVNIIA